MRTFLEQITLKPAPVEELYRTMVQKVHEADATFVPKKTSTRPDEPQDAKKDSATSEKTSQLFFKELTSEDAEDEMAFRNMRNRCKSEIRQWNIRKQATILDLARKNTNVLFKYYLISGQVRVYVPDTELRVTIPNIKGRIGSKFYGSIHTRQPQLLTFVASTSSLSLTRSVQCQRPHAKQPRVGLLIVDQMAVDLSAELGNRLANVSSPYEIMVPSTELAIITSYTPNIFYFPTMTFLELKCKLANYVDVTFRGPTDRLAAQALLRHIFPKTDCCVVDMKVLDDGLSNQLVLLTCDKQLSGHSCARKSLLVRIYGLVTNSLIDRTMELLCMTAFHAHGGMPKVYAVFNNGIAYSFIPGRTLPPTDLGSPKYWREQVSVCLSLPDPVDPIPCTLRKYGFPSSLCRLIASELAQFHCLLVRDPLIQAYGKASTDPGPQDCVTFPRLYAWISLLKTKSGTNGFCEHRLPSISDLLHEVDEMASILQHASTPIVLCHNDLLAGNIIISPDEKSVHFIDLEYSGFARAAADIGNHFCEYAGVDHPDYTNYPSLPFQRDWMRCYLQHVRDFQTHCPPPVSNPVNGDRVPVNGGDTSSFVLEDDPMTTTVEIDQWLREVNYFALVAHLTWSIWAAVRSCDDEHKFNFAAYSMTRINEYHRMKKIILATFVEGQKAPEDFVIP
ncbi:hypothetical protein T265_05217 [Opisthorchis viverrini]|uniref:ethanolamine kinase n=1 Tax=Opisthorchis viverrini TaxID=6198 RepID=A0A074ZWS3_OPIVI|nr:hypothetical protein T265_05217 [Opisthorchis viverrini]KER27790.1 hypothetical protein T265_05217 [Opisthorchis viverrini]